MDNPYKCVCCAQITGALFAICLEDEDWYLACSKCEKEYRMLEATEW